MEHYRQYKPLPGFSLQIEGGNCQRWPALCSRESAHHPGAQVGCCLAFTWHWVISLWGWLGRWFLKGRISLLALVLGTPAMRAGQLAESSLLPLSLPCTRPASPPPASAFPTASSPMHRCHPGLHLAAPCSPSLCLLDAPLCCWSQFLVGFPGDTSTQWVQHSALSPPPSNSALRPCTQQH